MPTCASNGEEIDVIRDVPQNFERRMMLEKEIHLYANAANVLEHIAELHVFRIRSETVKSVPR